MNKNLHDNTIDMGLGLIYSKEREAWLEYSEAAFPVVFGIFAARERMEELIEKAPQWNLTGLKSAIDKLDFELALAEMERLGSSHVHW